MLTNIFKKKTKKQQSKIKPKIIVDIHEKNSLVPSQIIEQGIDIEFKSLKVGDYLINNIAIERKTFSDLISSMIKKRLLQQLNQLQQYKQRLLIIEGKQTLDKNSSVHANSIRGQILSAIFYHQIPIISTKDSRETAIYLSLLAKQQQKPIHDISLHSRIPKTKKEQQEYILEAFPSIGPKTAVKLLKEFKTLNNIFNASEETDLKKILKGKTKSFLNLLDK